MSALNPEEELDTCGAPGWVAPHCRAVAALAVKMANEAAGRGHAVDTDLIRVGALLHDVGRRETQDVWHAHLGADWLRGRGWPEPVARIVECHTGAGISADEALEIGLPARSYVPQSWEEKIVAHADNLYSGSRRLRLAEVEKKYSDKGLDLACQRISRLHAELATWLGVDPDLL